MANASTIRCGLRNRDWLGAVLILATQSVAITTSGAAPCMFATLGEGRVTEIVDARSFRLADGREVRLAGIEPPPDNAAAAVATLGALLRDRDVVLRGEDDAPDRYGRQRAFAFLAGLRSHPGCSGGRRAHRVARTLDVPDRHKKRGKSRRYFGSRRAIYGCRREGVVRTTDRDNNLSELRA